jgi:hypothetical protein
MCLFVAILVPFVAIRRLINSKHVRQSINHIQQCAGGVELVCGCLLFGGCGAAATPPA